MSAVLEKARVYESQMGEVVKGRKPAFHVTAPIGWINDPNGFSMFQKEAHLFYQYHPYSTKWGPMHWGHCKTRDFIKWEQLPCAIAPDTVYDGQGCFSGSAVEWNKKHVLMYTSVLEKDDEEGNHIIRQTQSIAIGDGINYEKAAQNPVILGDVLPKGSSLEDFRDPKIWEQNGKLYAVVGSRNEDGSGQIALFSSENALDWNFESILDRSRNRYGKMWECPDFFYLDGKNVLVTSPQDMQAEDLEFHNGNGTIYLVGEFEAKNGTFERSLMQARAIDYGLDFYAPQTLLTEDGRRIMIAWMQSWDTVNLISPGEFSWRGQLTLPRELHLIDGKLYQNPVKELENYYANSVEKRGIAAARWTQIEGIQGRMLDMTVDVAEGDYEKFCIRLADDGRFHTDVVFDPKESVLTFDRTYAGICRDTVTSRSMRVADRNGAIRLRIVLDRYSVEIFVNDGQQAMTSLIFTDQEADRISFKSSGNVQFDVTKHEIVVK